MVPITEDFPGAPLVFKPIGITRTNFYILLAKHDRKDPLGTFSKLSDFIRTLVIPSDDYSDYDDDLTDQVADDDRGQTSYSQDLSQTTGSIRIHWWAIPVHYTGEQLQSAIKLGSRPTIRPKTVKGRKKR